MGGEIRTLDDFLGLLSNVKRQANGQHMALCPGHEDHKHSLSVKEKDHRILVHCFAGCDLASILRPLGLGTSDLNLNHRGRSTGERSIDATYDYTDEKGNLLYQKVRYRPKDFSLRRPDGNGGWIWNLDGVRKVLYRLPDIHSALDAEGIYITEGEKDADALTALGATATCNPHGAGEWDDSYGEALRGMNVLILPDNDAAGRQHAATVAGSLAGKAAGIRILELPGEGVKDASDWIAAGGTLKQLHALGWKVDEWEPTADATPPPPDTPLPTVAVNNRQLRDVSHDALEALRASNTPPSLFVRAGALARVGTDEKGQPSVQTLGEAALRGCLTRSANFTVISSTDEVNGVSPPLPVARDILSLGHWPFPALAGIAESPVVRPDGTILDAPGFDKRTGLYLVPPPGFEMPAIAESPTPEQVKVAMTLIREPFIDLPFDSQASCANAIGALFTLFCRPIIPSMAPAFVIDKPQPGTGASLVCEILSLIATGRSAPMMEMPRNQEEFEKVMVAAVWEGHPLVIIDNAEGTVDSSVLARFLTSPSPLGRILGRSQTVRLPNDSTNYMINGNNIKFGRNLIRRVYRCRLDARHPTPWKRDVPFKHDPIQEWLLENRARIIAAILAVVRAWVLADRPCVLSIRMGNYTPWAQTIGGILDFAGVQGFLDNSEETASESDSDTAQWSAFLAQLHDLYGKSAWTVADLVRLMKEDQLDGSDRLSAVLPHGIDRDFNRINRSLGNALAKHADARYLNGLMVVKAGEKKHAITWRVIRYSDPGELGSQEEEEAPF